MVQSDVQLLQDVLRESENDSNLRVTSVDEIPAVARGENFMSDVVRLILKGASGNGSPFVKYLISKRALVLENGENKEDEKSLRSFRNEATMYRAFKELPTDCQNFTAKCMHATDTEIILEDLKPQGFVMVKKQIGLDLDHSLLVLKCLGDLHAGSLLMKRNDTEKFNLMADSLKDIFFTNDDKSNVFAEALRKVIDSVQNILIDDVEAADKWAPALKFLNDKSRDDSTEIQEQLKPKKHSVLLAGDLWSNNMLFKYDNQNRVKDVRLLDFQLARYASFAIDLQYFLNNGLSHNIFSKHKDLLLSTYHTRLVSHLPDDLANELTLDYVKKEMEDHNKYGFYFSILLTPAVTLDSESLPDKTEMMELRNDMDKLMKAWLNNYNDAYIQRIKDKCEYFLLSGRVQ